MAKKKPKEELTKKAPYTFETEDLLKLSLKAIEEHNLLFIEDITAYLPCSRATFYNHNLDKVDAIKDALLNNKINLKVSMRKKWHESENATLQMGLMKLIANAEELRQLSMTHIESENTHKVEITNNLSDEAKQKIKDILEGEY